MSQFLTPIYEKASCLTQTPLPRVPMGSTLRKPHSLFLFIWTSLFIYLFILFIYLFMAVLDLRFCARAFMAVLGLRFCARAFSSCGKWGPLFITVRGPLTIAASLVAEHRLQTRRLSSCGSRA